VELLQLILDYLVVPLFLWVWYAEKRISVLEIKIIDISDFKDDLQGIKQEVHTLVTLSKIHFGLDKDKN
jgi:hypothetical protein